MGRSRAVGYGGTCLPRQLPLWLWWEIVFLALFTSELCRGATGAPLISALAAHACAF